MRTPRRHRGRRGTLRIDRLLRLYRLYHLNPRSVLAVSPRHIGSNKPIARGAAVAPDLHECLILRSGVFAASRRMRGMSWFETAQKSLLTMRDRPIPKYHLMRQTRAGLLSAGLYG